MNLANQLTLARLFLTVGFVIAMTVSWPFSKTAALALFVVAGITDYLDGEIARRWNLISDFGKLMDPLIDKIMIAAAFILLATIDAPAASRHPIFPPWVAIVVISREFLITGLRLLALSKGRILAAEKLGKHKTVWQIVTIIFFLALLAERELFKGIASWEPLAWSYAGPALLTFTVGLTLLSGVGYLWKNRAVIEIS